MEDKLTYFELHGYKILVDSNEILYGDTTTKLTPKEMEVLTMLYRHEGSTVSRSDLLESVWGGPYGNDLGLTQAVSRLRRVFNDNPKNPGLIRTIPKKGYQLISDNKSVDSEVTTYNTIKNTSALKKFYKAGIILLLVIAMMVLFLLLFDIRIRVQQLPVSS